MSLTITIPGAVDVTTGSMAPAVLTIGVGVPGAQGPQGPAGPGVPVGGTAGQYLQKIDGTNYNTDWVTLNLSAYLTTSAAASTYYPLTNPASYITSAALSPYLLSSTAASTYQTIAGMSSYLTTSDAASTYAPLASPLFTGDARAVTPTFGDNDTSIATTAFVQSALAGGTAVARNLEVEVRNQSGSTIPAGSIVYISGATGNKPVITLAQANNDANSAQTIGFVKTSIANNGTGYVIIRGELENIDTSALTEGVQLYLSPTTAGTWTTTKPSAPQHLVYVGVVIRSHPTLGTILVAVQNGYELDELHDVAIASKADNDLLAYESSTDLWKNKTFSALGLLTSADAATTYAPIASPALTGNVTITSNSATAALTITQDGAGDILRLNDVAADTTFTFVDALGKVNTVAATTASAGLNVPHGVAPTTPVNGDIWSTASGLFSRINGSTQQYPTLSANNTFSNASGTFGSSTAAGTINVASGATISGATKAVNIGTAGVVGSTTTTIIGPVLGASTTSIGGTTAASTLNLATGATLTATTKAVNIGTSGVAGSTTNITIGSTTGTSTTTLQGITNGVTEAVDTNNTELATTAFVVGQAGSATPIVDGTAAVGTSLRYARQDHVHPTDTTRAALASPTFTGTPLSTTAAVDTNTTQIATTAFVVAQAAAATPLVDGTAAVGTSTRYARADHVHPTDTTRAPLNSPSFSGTPSLPTGTTGVTQTAGNNTTALATTAFVTAAVPAFGATADVNEPISTTKAASIDNVREMLMSPAHQIFYQGAGVSGTSGAGAAVNLNSGRWKEYVSPNATVAGYGIGVFDTTAANIGFAGYTRGQNLTTRNWSKKVWLSGRCMVGHFSLTSYNGSANTFARISLGGFNVIQSGDMVSGIKGIGWRLQGGGSQALTLQVCNGTTVTNVTSSFTPVTKQVFDWEIYSDGAGNVTLFVNDSQVATTTAGPTGTAATGLYMEGVDSTASSTAPFILNNLGTKIFFGI